MTSPILENELTREHALDLLRREKAVLRRLREIYEEARPGTLGRLGEVSAATSTATSADFRSGLITRIYSA